MHFQHTIILLASFSLLEAADPPLKFVNEEGVSKINPEWKAWNKQQGGKPSSIDDLPVALAVVSTDAEFEEMNAVAIAAGGGLPDAGYAVAELTQNVCLPKAN
jgi:hypothetical protein